jgi:hypothetical protein
VMQVNNFEMGIENQTFALLLAVGILFVRRLIDCLIPAKYELWDLHRMMCLEIGLKEN